MAKLQPGFALSNDIPYLALTGKLWGVFREFFKKKFTAIYRERTVLLTANIVMDGTAMELSNDKDIMYQQTSELLGDTCPIIR